MVGINRLRNLVNPDNNDVMYIVDIDGSISGRPKTKKITVENLLAKVDTVQPDLTFIKSNILAVEQTNNTQQQAIDNLIVRTGSIEGHLEFNGTYYSEQFADINLQLSSIQDNLSELETGIDGLSAYQIAVNLGFQGTVEDWVLSLKGANGTDGIDGLSAYEIALINGFQGNESQWLLSLKGEQGIQGLKGDKGDKGDTGSTANILPGQWFTPTLLNSWSTFDVTPKYRKLSDGRLEVKGTVKLDSIPALPSTIFTLPVGYRPLETQRSVSLAQFNSESRTVRIGILNDGSVTFAAVSNSTVTNTSITSLPLYFTCSLD